MNKLSNDMYAIIGKYLSYADDIRALKLACKDMHISIPNIKFKIAYINRLLESRVIHNCLNNDCPLFEEEGEETTQRKKSKMIGIITFYYENDYKGPVNIFGRPWSSIDVPKITRIIPYCFTCCEKYVEYGSNKSA